MESAAAPKEASFVSSDAVSAPITPNSPYRKPLQPSFLQPTSPLPASPTMNKVKNNPISSLMSAPLKLSEVDELTPGKENTVLGKFFKESLGINSPATPKSSTKSRDKDSSALTPVNSKKRLRQFSLDDSFLEEEPGSKKTCQASGGKEFEKSPKWHKSYSESALMDMDKIKSAVEKKDSDPLLIGDCSGQYVLPVIPAGKHPDLKEITAETLAKLLDGEYDVKYWVIDCRYPYEYEGGHVKGSVNLYTEAQVHKKYFESRKNLVEPAEQEILIFHCEFSVERGPKMCRSVRDWDRYMNILTFPSLHYPEMYVLHRGYKGFYEEYPSYCSPSAYMKMIDDPEQLSIYKKKCKNELVKTKSKSVPAIKLGRSISVKKFVL